MVQPARPAARDEQGGTNLDGLREARLEFVDEREEVLTRLVAPDVLVRAQVRVGADNVAHKLGRRGLQEHRLERLEQLHESLSTDTKRKKVLSHSCENGPTRRRGA